MKDQISVRHLGPDKFSRPRIQNVKNGRVYVDISCGDPDQYPDDFYRHNINGYWHTTSHGEPDIPIRSSIEFIVKDTSDDRSDAVVKLQNLFKFAFDGQIQFGVGHEVLVREVVVDILETSKAWTDAKFNAFTDTLTRVESQIKTSRLGYEQDIKTRIDAAYQDLEARVLDSLEKRVAQRFREITDHVDIVRKVDEIDKVDRPADTDYLDLDIKLKVREEIGSMYKNLRDQIVPKCVDFALDNAFKVAGVPEFIDSGTVTEQKVDYLAKRLDVIFPSDITEIDESASLYLKGEPVTEKDGEFEGVVEDRFMTSRGLMYEVRCEKGLRYIFEDDLVESYRPE